MTELEIEEARRAAAKALANAGIKLTPGEASSIEVTDFGLGSLAETGLQIVTYVNTDRCCAKELVMFAGQTCPEHYHPPFDGSPGKEETFRVRKGTVYLYVPGPAAEAPKCQPARAEQYTVWREVKLEEGDQYTLAPRTKHWFQSPDGVAIVSEFSTTSRDELDIFTDPDIQRMA